MTDQEIVASLIGRDPQATARFFFNDCRPLFLSVIRRVFGTQAVDYDEIISELYVLLMENDAKKLRSFRFESTLYQWLKTTAIRHCLWLKQKARVIDNESQEPPINKGGGTFIHREFASADRPGVLAPTDEKPTVRAGRTPTDDRRPASRGGGTAVVGYRRQPV